MDYIHSVLSEIFYGVPVPVLIVFILLFLVLCYLVANDIVNRFNN